MTSAAGSLKRLALATTALIVLAASPAIAQDAAPAPKGTPADLCAESIAFVRKDEQRRAQEATAKAAQGTGTAVGAPTKEAAPAKAGGSDAPQQTSGLSAPVTHDGAGASGPQGNAQESAPSAANTNKADDGARPQAPAATAQAPKPAPANPAPAAAAAPVAPTPTPEQAAQVEAAARSGDWQACRQATQVMRRAGVALPPELMALAALDPKFGRAVPQAAEPATQKEPGAGSTGP